MNLHHNTQPITDFSQLHPCHIARFPHTVRYPVASIRKPKSYMESTLGYQIIRVDDDILFGHDTDKGILLDKVAFKGDYLAQSNFTYETPRIYHSYADLIKDFYIPKASKIVEGPVPLDDVPYGTDDVFVAQRQEIIQRYQEELERVKNTPRARMKKIYF